MIGLQVQTRPDRVAGIQPIGRIALCGVRDVLLESVLRHAREQQIARKVRYERQAGIAGDQRALNVQIAGRMLPAHRAELSDLALVLVEILARVRRYPVDHQPERGLLTVQVRNLKLADRAAEHDRDAILLVQDVLEVAEAVILRGVIVDGIRAAVRRLDAEVVAQKIARNEVAVGSGATAVAEARLDLAVTAAVQGYGAALGLNAALGGDIENAGGAQSVFRRQRAGHQTDRGDEARIERLPEHGNSLGKDDAVDTVLQAVVLAAHVELSEGVLRHVRRLQHHLVEQGVVGARGRCDGRRIEGIGRRAGLGLDAGAPFIQMLSGNGDRGQYRGIGTGGRGIGALRQAARARARGIGTLRQGTGACHAYEGCGDASGRCPEGKMEHQNDSAKAASRRAAARLLGRPMANGSASGGGAAISRCEYRGADGLESRFRATLQLGTHEGRKGEGMAESRRNHLRKRRAQRTLAVDRARLDPEVGAVSARQVADFVNDRTLLSGNDQQHQAQHSVQMARQGSEVRATRHEQKLTESAANCSI